MMAPGDSQECSWVARGLEVMSRLVCFLYSFRVAAKMASNFVEDWPVEIVWDVLLVDGCQDVVPIARVSLIRRGDRRVGVAIIQPPLESAIIPELSERTRHDNEGKS
jgi:hypothetical protein